MAAFADDPRYALAFDETVKEGGVNAIGLIGVPCDAGVSRNGGRPGACKGPSKFREYLFQKKIGTLFNPEYGVDLNSVKMQDLGDIVNWTTLEEMHEKLHQKVLSALESGHIPVMIGGGNDQSYPNASALMSYLGHGNIGVVNIDAHLDVRPLKNGLAHSGSPFRQLIQDTRFCGRFVEFAAQGYQCSAAHAQFVLDNKGEIFWLSKIRHNAVENFKKVLASFEDRPVFVSFDIDSIRGADCPGVSCPGVVGLTSNDALEMAFEAGKWPTVKMLDISEFNPSIESDRTGRLVVAIFYYFGMGVASRCCKRVMNGGS